MEVLVDQLPSAFFLSDGAKTQEQRMRLKVLKADIPIHKERGLEIQHEWPDCVSALSLAQAKP